MGFENITVELGMPENSCGALKNEPVAGMGPFKKMCVSVSFSLICKQAVAFVVAFAFT